MHSTPNPLTLYSCDIPVKAVIEREKARRKTGKELSEIKHQ